MGVIEKIKKSEWITRFSRMAERKFFFVMTIFMLIWGLMYKIGIIQG